MTSSITKSTISLWDTLPKEIADEIMEFNKPPCLDELKDKHLLEWYSITMRSVARTRSRYHLATDLAIYRTNRFLVSMGWKETVPYMKHMCKENRIKGYSRLRKRELINILIKM